MNKSVSSILRLLAVTLLFVMAVSLVSCDKIPFLNQGNDEHTHSFADGKCECGANDPDYLPHQHNFVEGECECGEIDPDYDPHEHVFVDGICECGECDINYDPHKHNFVEGKCECGEIDPNYVPHEHVFVDGICECGEIDPDYVPSHEHNFVDGKCECGETNYRTITIAEALEIAAANPDGTTELYYIRATVKSLVSSSYGEMYITDETGEIYVYGTRGEDGTTFFDKLPERPVKGDEVLLLCQLSQYGGNSQVKLARLIEFKHVEVKPEDLTAYESMTIADARNAESGKLVRVSGVVAQITYANGRVPSGVILVDGTSSIYVYSNDLAGQVSIGNTVEIAASKAYWILESEIGNANKFEYKGSNQLEDVVLISNDKASSDFNKDWITESTVKAIMDTPVSNDITSMIFKVNALVKKAPGNGFVNYYIDDIDGVTGSYVYTQCNGSDFEWLDQFDGKICTVYLVALNAKSTSTGCTWRFLPVAVSDDGYTFDTNKAAEYAVKYHGVGQFLSNYTGDPALELITSVSSELLGFEGATISYSSSDESVINFVSADGKIVMHCNKTGTAVITVTANYGENSYSESLEIAVETNETIDYITVADAILAADDTIVTVKGIVGPSVVNRNAFYFFGEDGSVITVLVNDVNIFSEIEIGHEIIIEGKREHFVNAEKYNGNYIGQATIVEAVVIANYYGNHQYSTEKFVTDKTVEDLRNLDIKVDYSTTVFVVDAIVDVQETAYYTNIKLLSTDGSVNITLYCSSAAQYNWLKAYAGQTVTLELAGCNWNDKSYWTFCAIALVNEDGTKVLNTLNFN